MADTIITTRATRAAVLQAIARIPQEASAGGPTANAMMTRVGLTALGRIKRAFIVKARGGTDEAGDRWAPLSPKTIAGRNRSRGTGGRTRTELARGRATGKTSFVKKYGNRQVEILRDTGLLLNSLSPGVSSAEQIFKVGYGEIVIGTNRKGAADHHTGIPGRLPQRRLWPEPRKWPANWWLDITEQARDGLIDIAIQLVGEAR